MKKELERLRVWMKNNIVYIFWEKHSFGCFFSFSKNSVTLYLSDWVLIIGSLFFYRAQVYLRSVIAPTTEVMSQVVAATMYPETLHEISDDSPYISAIDMNSTNANAASQADTLNQAIPLVQGSCGFSQFFVILQCRNSRRIHTAKTIVINMMLIPIGV